MEAGSAAGDPVGGSCAKTSPLAGTLPTAVLGPCGSRAVSPDLLAALRAAMVAPAFSWHPGRGRPGAEKEAPPLEKFFAPPPPRGLTWSLRPPSSRNRERRRTQQKKTQGPKECPLARASTTWVLPASVVLA